MDHETLIVAGEWARWCVTCSCGREVTHHLVFAEAERAVRDHTRAAALEAAAR